MKEHRNLPVPLDFEQPSFWIEHPVNGDLVPQHPQTGYINATLLCDKAGKLFADYNRLAQTQAFLEELSLDMGIPISNLVQVIRGRGDRLQQGTWVHPDVAINLGQWLSPRFAVQVSRWVREWMLGTTRVSQPEHVQRYMLNRAKIPPGYFSMLNEIYLGLLAPLEEYGVTPPDRVIPDISTGLMFSRFLRDRGINPNDFPTYQHEFIDPNRPLVQARLYPDEHLAEFRRYFHNVWLPQRAKSYFTDKFPNALPILDRILQLPAPPGTLD